MPLNKEDLSFKTLINKEFSTPSRLFFQENTVSTLDTNDTEVYSNTIPPTTASAISEGVGRVLIDFALTPDPSFPTSVWYVVSGSGFTPGVSALPSFATSASFYQRNFISDKYGSAYTVILKDNLGNQIFPTDAINWIFQYKTGILAIADPGLGSYSTPYRVTVVQYTGRTLSDNRTKGYSGSFSGSFQGDGSGLINLSASAIVGLNLSQIASGSVTASISPNTGFVVNTNTNIQGALTASSAIISGNVTVLGTASINNLVVNQTKYSSGSNQLGDGIEDTQTLFGTVRIPTGSLTVTGSALINQGNFSINFPGQTSDNILTFTGLGSNTHRITGTNKLTINYSFTDIPNSSNIAYAVGNKYLAVGSSSTSFIARLYVKGLGTTSSTTALLVENANASASLAVLDDGTTTITGNTTITGSLTVVTGSSIELQVTNTGVKIGNATTDIHPVTGSLTVSGSITGSLFGTASFANTASFVNPLTQSVSIRGTGTTSATTTLLIQNSAATNLLTIQDNGQLTVSSPQFVVTSSLISLAASQSAFTISQPISASNVVGGQYYGVNITPTFFQTTSSQTETAFRVAATFTQSSAAATGGTNIIADFGATSVGSQLTVTDITSGSIYMVNDVSGLPIIEATSDWTVKMYDFPNVVFEKTGSNVNIYGTLNATGSFILPLSQSITPVIGSAYWSGSFLFIYDGTQYRSSSFA